MRSLDPARPLRYLWWINMGRGGKGVWDPRGWDPDCDCDGFGGYEIRKRDEVVTSFWIKR